MAEETTEQRLARLEHDAATQAETLTQTRAITQSMFGIVKEMSQKQDEMLGAVRSIQAHEAIADARLSAMAARLDAADAHAKLSESLINGRFDRMKKTLSDILAGNAQQTEIMLQVLAKLGEKQGE